MDKKTILVSGATGMDGSIMIDYLLQNTDCEVVGLTRRLSNRNWKNIEHNLSNPRFKTDDCDITDSISVDGVIQKYKPHYFFHFGANSFVGNSWSQPYNHLSTNTLGVLFILEAIRKYSPNTRLYQAGSSEMFGDVKYSPQDEECPFNPSSVYGVSKAASHYLTNVYRNSYNLYCLSGILFNHESASGRRGEEFVTKKITLNIARIKKAIDNKQDFKKLRIGNLYSRRDWSSAEDFCDGIWRILNQESYREDLKQEYVPQNLFGAIFTETQCREWLSKKIKTYVLASGETYTVKDFINKTLEFAGINGSWVGEGMNEKFISVYNQEIVAVDPEFFRPNEVNLLLGNAELAKKELNWQPKYSFSQLVKSMFESDQKIIA